MKEVIQPMIVLPDEKDPMKWACYARIHSRWLRSVSPQLGLDTEKLMLGDVLSSIIGDDSNALGFYIPNLIDNARSSLLERLNWEIETPELPNAFRKKLRKVKNTIFDFEWDSKEKWVLAKDIWTKASEQIESKIRRDPKLDDAIRYDLDMSKVLSPYYQEFLHQDTFFPK